MSAGAAAAGTTAGGVRRGLLNAHGGCGHGHPHPVWCPETDYRRAIEGSFDEMSRQVKDALGGGVHRVELVLDFETRRDLFESNNNNDGVAEKKSNDGCAAVSPFVSELARALAAPVAEVVVLRLDSQPLTDAEIALLLEQDRFPHLQVIVLRAVGFGGHPDEREHPDWDYSRYNMGCNSLQAIHGLLSSDACPLLRVLDLDGNPSVANHPETLRALASLFRNDNGNWKAPALEALRLGDMQLGSSPAGVELAAAAILGEGVGKRLLELDLYGNGLKAGELLVEMQKIEGARGGAGAAAGAAAAAEGAGGRTARDEGGWIGAVALQSLELEVTGGDSEIAAFREYIQALADRDGILGNLTWKYIGTFTKSLVPRVT